MESKSEWAEEEGDDDSIRGRGRASRTFLQWFRTTEIPAGCFGCPVEINTYFSRVEGFGMGCVAFMTVCWKPLVVAALGEIASTP